METQLHTKKQKKILNGQGCRTGTDARTNLQTDARESIYTFLPESKDIRETKKLLFHTWVQQRPKKGYQTGLPFGGNYVPKNAFCLQGQFHPWHNKKKHPGQQRVIEIDYL